MNIHLFKKVYGKGIKTVSLLIACLLPFLTFAQNPKKVSDVSNPFAMAMIAIAVFLLVAIYMVSRLLVQQAQSRVTRFKKQQKDNAAKIVAAVVIICLSFANTTGFAQDTASAAPAASALVPILSDTSFYGLVSVIAAELIILVAMLIQLKAMMSAEELEEATMAATAAGIPVEAVKKDSSWKKVWDKANSFKPLQEESTIDLGHDYDGIRELDNRLPPWWIYGFLLCILFACVYLWRTQVSHSAPTGIEEYQASVAKAAVEKEAYLAKSKSSVDENTVKVLTESADIEAGKKIFTSVCVACHLADGGGGVGPNLTDNYWIHGGSIKDVFKTLKYGWPEKGMKSWKDDYSALQLAQIASYVKSLQGTKPATPKDPQGELYKEEGAAPAVDSTKVVDSTKITASIK